MDTSTFEGGLLHSFIEKNKLNYELLEVRGSLDATPPELDIVLVIVIVVLDVKSARACGSRNV